MNKIQTEFPLQFTESATNKVKYLLTEEKNLNMKFRVYITGGGCSGFQYCFILDEKINDDDFIMNLKDVKIVVDPMSLQYLIGGLIDYKEELEGSKFIVINPNAKITCSCGSSFSIF